MSKKKYIIKRTEALHIGSVMLSAYYVIVDNEPTIVMAENISDACDKLDELGVLEYEFIHAKSIAIVH